MSGLRYAPALEDGEPGRPGRLVTAIPTWREGDTFLACTELQRSRIPTILPEWDEDGAIHAVWFVGPVVD